MPDGSRTRSPLYGGLKAVSFCALALLLARPSFGALTGPGAFIRIGIDALVLATVLFSIVRAIPVIWDGRLYVARLDGAPAGQPSGAGAEPSDP